MVVNNAAWRVRAELADITPVIWEEALAVNVHAPFLICKAVLPSMLSQKWGRIINISSVSVKTPVNNLFLSNSIRLGVLGWAKALSDEVGKDGITVNTVCPGSTRTNRITSLFSVTAKETGQTIEEIEEISSKNIPIGRIGEPQELAALIAFLASEKASYMTGLAIQVDGGSARGYF